MKKLSETLKEKASKISEQVEKRIKKILGEKTAELHEGVVIVEHDDFNECIVSVHGEDLTINTNFNGDIAEKIGELKDCPLQIQIEILKRLEDEEYEIGEEEEDY